TKVSAPISIAVDPISERAYLVNSNERVEFLDSTLMILNITNPISPTLVNTAPLPNSSGQAYFSAAQKRVYLPNRHSDNNQDKSDRLLMVNVDEASPTFLSVSDFLSGDNPFGIACCDPRGRFLVASNGGQLLRYDPVGDLSASTSFQFDVTLGSGEHIEGKGVSEVAIIADQAFVTSRAGQIFVVNLTELGDPLRQPLDYVITGEPEDLRGIATDGTLLFVVDAIRENPSLLVVNPESLKPTDAAATSEVTLASINTKAINLGLDTDPNEVVYFAARKELYVSNFGTDTISVINADNLSLITTISLNTGGFISDQPFGLAAFTLGGTDYLYVTNLASNNLLVINLATRAVVGSYP
ncbi:MAG: hypothetical protein Q7S98_00680, partial [Deltaproteobacteria bacterium]|nr:hypothetical protein [Deltaproteobacteria bacterium]